VRDHNGQALAFGQSTAQVTLALGLKPGAHAFSGGGGNPFGSSAESPAIISTAAMGNLATLRLIRRKWL
jgi:hypothetical protein